MNNLTTIAIAVSIFFFNSIALTLVFYVTLDSVLDVIASRTINVTLYQSWMCAIAALALRGHALIHFTTK
jgi:ABC-type arginine/histidine transport system permease subunit